jgi:hypothetical protein
MAPLSGTRGDGRHGRGIETAGVAPAVRTRSQRDERSEECSRDTPHEKDATRVNCPGPHRSSSFGARSHHQTRCDHILQGMSMVNTLEPGVDPSAALYTAWVFELNFGPYMLLTPEYPYELSELSVVTASS